MKKVGEKYEVVYAEMQDGRLMSEEMTLVKVSQYKGKEIYIFQDEQGYYMASYNYDEDDIDWSFLEEINDKFIV